MKILVKRALFLMLSLCILITLFSCGSDDGSKPSDEAKKIISTDDISFTNAEGKATFNIVRAESENEKTGPVAVDIFKKYKELHKAAPKQMTDSDDGTDCREILVGDCDREASRQVKKLFEIDGSGRDSDFIICSVGDDIVIRGGCEASLKAAGQYFIENFLPTDVKGGIYYHHKGNEAGLTVCSISDVSKFTVVRPIYNVSYLTQCETDKLIDVLYKKTGYEVSVIHDNTSVYKNVDAHIKGVLEPTAITEYEIIIGNSQRDGVKKIGVAYNYEIRIEGTKIYLNGGSPYATAMAVSEFIKIVENNSAIDSSMSVLNGNYNNVVKSYDTKTNYRPVWWDEFNGTEIDESKWRVAWGAKGGVSVDGKTCYRGNKELKNNYVKDGKLYIEAVETEDAYYGGMLKTDSTMEFLYGFLEISDVHPKGNGFWTALWTVSKSGKYNKEMWYSETDIDESFGEGNMIKGNLWAWPTSHGRFMNNLNNGRADTVKDHGEYNTDDPRGLWMDMHTYGFEWVDNKTIRFTIDGYVWRETELQEEELQKVYAQYMVLQISMATAFDSRGLVTQDEWHWKNTNKFIVDWIYLYQKDGHGLLRYR